LAQVPCLVVGSVISVAKGSAPRTLAASMAMNVPIPSSNALCWGR
jgi:hypothetical protein